MAFWGGRSSVCDEAITTPRSRVLSFRSYDKILNMQTELISVGGKRVSLWMRDWSGEVCPCVKENQPASPHSICWGTGWAGGYKKFGYREWSVYRKGITLYRFVDESQNNYDIVPTVVGNQHIVTTGWISGADLTGPLLSDGKRRGLTIEFSLDDLVWTASLGLPVVQFKMRVTADDNTDFEIMRVRGRELVGDNYILLSEVPPRRLKELERAGVKESIVDIRCWTLGTPFLYTGDMIQWEKGHALGDRYVVVDKKISQMRRSDTELKTITQVLGMRFIRTPQQLARVW